MANLADKITMAVDNSDARDASGGVSSTSTFRLVNDSANNRIKILIMPMKVALSGVIARYTVAFTCK